MAENHRGVPAIASVPSSVVQQLRQTMVLGLPVIPSHRPTFYFAKQVNWSQHDSERQPWDFRKAPDSSIERDPVQPVCAFEFSAPIGRTGADFTEVGDFYGSTVIFTFVGESDFAEVEGASHATVGPKDTKWHFRYWRPSLGLGGIPVFQATFQAQDTA